MYIYLTPSIADKGAECAYFVHLTYQNLLDHIFERLLALSDINERTKFILTEYVNNLSLPSDYVDEKKHKKRKHHKP